ncbi:unnamed protein product [Mortierella alpina]
MAVGKRLRRVCVRGEGLSLCPLEGLMELCVYTLVNGCVISLQLSDSLLPLNAHPCVRAVLCSLTPDEEFHFPTLFPPTRSARYLLPLLFFTNNTNVPLQ